MGKRRRRKTSGLKGIIRAAYRVLGTANTANVILTGDLGKIARHTARKRTVKFGGKIVKS